MTRNMKRRSTRINREMGRVQYQAVIEKDIGIRDMAIRHFVLLTSSAH